MASKYCIIMAGGVGSRFWPVSRNAVPKQFLDILGTGSSFLQQTYNRFLKIIPKENILIVTSEIYADITREQLPDIPKENILLEPHKRNTAPCIAYATYKLLKRDPNAVVVVAPSDHLIIDESKFLNTVEKAMLYASENDVLCTMGIKPTRPETGYGYIQMNCSDIKVIEGLKAYSVKTFTEKPDKELAKVLVNSGEFLWNSGIFVWNLQTIKAEMENYIPDIASQFREGMDLYYTEQEEGYIKSLYENCNGISIDYGVMEKTSKSWVFESHFGWSDLGTWDSLYNQLEKDESGNLVQSNLNMIDKVKNSIIVSSDKNKLIVVKDLDNYMVINTNDVLLICPRNSKDYKDVITDLALNEFSDFQ